MKPRTSEQAFLWQERLDDLALVRRAAIESPLIELPEPIEGNNRVLLKMESAQDIKSFKIRGATYAMASRLEELRERGVVADSGGNHAQAVALAGRTLGVPVAIIMAALVPDNKVEATRGFGATDGSFTLDTSPSDFVEAKKQAKRFAGIDEQGRGSADPRQYPYYLSPYDDPAILRGTATIVPEVITQLERKGIERIDTLHVPVGGGGLIGGIADVNAEQGHLFDLYGHGITNADSGARSLHSPVPVPVAGTPNILAEGLAVTVIGDQGHQRMKDGKITDIYTSTVEEVGHAYAWYREHVLPLLGGNPHDTETAWQYLPELSSMVAISGLLNHLRRTGARDQTHVVVVSGGNTNRERSQAAIDAASL